MHSRFVIVFLLLASAFFLLSTSDSAYAESADTQVDQQPFEMAHFDLFFHTHDRRVRRDRRQRRNRGIRRDRRLQLQWRDGEWRRVPLKRKKRRVKRVRKPLPPIKADWYPKEKSKEVKQIVVTLPLQQLTVYQGTKPLVTSKISSGQPGYSTPAGVFSILRKARHHRSNIYSNAPMPFMQRLTWTGIALHESNSVPDHPASHGCVRLPNGFAHELYGFTRKGIHVVIANEEVEPVSITHSRLFRPDQPAPKDFDQIEAEFKAGIKELPKKKKTKHEMAPLRVLLTRYTGRKQIEEVQRMLNALSFDSGEVDGVMGRNTSAAIKQFQEAHSLTVDGQLGEILLDKLYAVSGKTRPANGRLYVRQNFRKVFEGEIHIKGDKPLGSHLLTAMHFEEWDDDVEWTSVTLTRGSPLNENVLASASSTNEQADKPVAEREPKPEVSSASEALSRIEIPFELRQKINRLLTPGSSIAITNDGISRETTAFDTDFIILMQ